jgi:hypothetical protein
MHGSDEKFTIQLYLEHLSVIENIHCLGVGGKFTHTHTRTHAHTHTHYVSSCCAGVYRIRLVQGWICWRTLVTMVMKYQVINKEGSLLSGKLSAFQGRLSFMELNYTSC